MGASSGVDFKSCGVGFFKASDWANTRMLDEIKKRRSRLSERLKKPTPRMLFSDRECPRQRR